MVLLIFLKHEANIFDMMTQTMKTVLITGGTKGIGLEATKLFVANNYKVIVVSRNFVEFPEEIASKTTQTTFDLNEVDKISALVQQVGEIDILVNNAGIIHYQPYNSYDPKLKQQILNVNLHAPIELITQFSQGMIKNGGGRIVNVASIAGQSGHPDIWYGVTKAGIINATKSFAHLLGEQNIAVNCVAPSIVQGTSMFEQIPQERKQHQLDKSITHTFVQPESVAQTIYWLAVDAPAYINGTCIDINNGLLYR